MSYVHKKIRVFREAGDVEVRRRRSDGRMKTYTSATDARAWCDSTEERRQHILDLVRQGDGKGLSLGKYIPIEAIIDILLANKNADIRRLLSEIEELKRIIRDHGIQYEERPIRIIEPEEQKQSAYGGESRRGGPGTTESEHYEKRKVEAAEAEPHPGSSIIRDKAATGTRDDSSGQAKDTTGAPGATPSSTSGTPTKGGTAATDVLEAKAKESSRGADGPQAGTTGKGIAADADKGAVEAGKAGVDAGRTAEAEGRAGVDAKKSRADEGKTGADARKMIGADDGKAGKDEEKTGVGAKSGAGGAAGRQTGRQDEIEKEEIKLRMLDTDSDTEPSSEPSKEVKVIAKPKEDFRDSTETGDTSSAPFVSDSSDYESVVPDKSSKYRQEDERAAKELLAGKTPEDQVKTLKDAISDKEDIYRSEHAIAVEAIEKLETIKDIVEGNDSPRSSIGATVAQKPKKVSPAISEKGRSAPEKPAGRAYEGTADSCKAEIDSLELEIQSMKSKSSPEAEIIQREVQVLKKYCAQLAAIQRENADLKNERDILKDGITDDALKDKLAKLDEITKERDRLRAKVEQLEDELAGGEVTGGRYSDESRRTSSSFKEDGGDLRERLDRMQGLEDEVKSLRDKALMTDQAGDGADRDELLKKIAELEREAELCKCKMKEMELLKCENNCLKMRAEDLAKVQKDYEDLLKKTQGYDCLKAECAMYKTKYEALQSMEDELNQLRARAQRCDELERERELLMKEIQDCECCMNNQEDEIKRLACHIDCLTQDLDKRQDEMKVKVLTMRAKIEKKDCLIARSEQQLADVQDLLRNSIEQLSCETNCLRTKIEELEDEANKYRNSLTTTEEKYQALEVNYKTLQETNNGLVENNKALLESLESEKRTTTKLEEALRKAIKSDEHLKQMLKQAKCAIKCITQKLEKHDIIGSGRLEAERENYLKKIKELEEGMTEQPCGSDRIAQLEEELKKANATIQCLRFNLDQLKNVAEENESLKKLASQLQENAKSKLNKLEDTNENLSRKSQEIEDKCEDLKASLEQKEKIIQDLQNEIESLKQELEESKKNNENVEANLRKMSTVSESGLSEIEKLKGQMNVLNAEIDRLNFMLENQKKECDETIDRLKAKVTKSEQDANADLEVSRCKKENEVLKEEYEKLKSALEKERAEREAIDSNKQKEENEKLKEGSNLKEEINKISDENNKLQNESNKLKDENSKMKDENNKLKDENNKLKQEIEKLKQEIEKLKKEIANLSPNESAAKERDELLKQIEAQKKEIADLLNKINQPSKSGDVSILENKDKEIQNLKATIENLENKIKELETKNVELAKASDKSEKMGDLEKKLDAQNKENEKIKKDYDNLKKTNETLEKKLEELARKDQKIADLENQLKKCQESNEALKKQMSAAPPAGGEEKIKAEGGGDERIKELETELAKQKEECNNMISSLQEQYDRDIKNLRKENEQSINKLQAAHQESLQRLTKEHEEIAEKMKEEIKEKEASIKEKEASIQEKEASVQEKEASIEEKKSNLKKKDEESESQISEKKSLKEEKQKKLRIDGICICDILPSVIPISPTGINKDVKEAQTVTPRVHLPPPAVPHYPQMPMSQLQPPCLMPRMMPVRQPQQMVPCTPAVVASRRDEKGMTIKKIAELENKLMMKQGHTMQKITTLQSTVEQLKKELDVEKQRNNDLINRYTNQSKTVANMKVEMDLVKRENFQDKRKLENLNLTLKNYLGSGSTNTGCLSQPRSESVFKSTGIPHFHTELTVVRDDNKFKHNCVMKRRSCFCDRSSDSFEIDE